MRWLDIAGRIDRVPSGAYNCGEYCEDTCALSADVVPQSAIAFAVRRAIDLPELVLVCAFVRTR